ncbi:MAG: OB-fold nucleic acid binding domain-containing protein [Nanoarchaeota archaeon]
MNESLLYKSAIIVSIVGLILIFFISNSIEINDTTIDKITNGETLDTVKLVGEVVEITEKSNVTYLLIAETKEITAIAFSNNLSIKKGDSLEIIGKVDEYNGKKEIIAESITIK